MTDWAERVLSQHVKRPPLGNREGTERGALWATALAGRWGHLMTGRGM